MREDFVLLLFRVI
jgi:hypothetical protein